MKSFVRRSARAAAAWLVGRGLPVPEIALSRLPEYARLKKVLRHQHINCVLDVGANRGQFAMLVRRLGYQGDIHSFEPQESIFQALAKRAEGDPQWHCHQLAIGEIDGQMELRANQEQSEMTSLYPFSQEYGQAETEKVQIKRLDSMLEKLTTGLGEARVLLKADTEGHDLAVIRGAKKTLPSVRVLQAEVFVQPIYEGAPGYLEVLSEVEAAGFQLEHLAVVSVTKQDELMCLNALFTRPK